MDTHRMVDALTTSEARALYNQLHEKFRSVHEDRVLRERSVLIERLSETINRRDNEIKTLLSYQDSLRETLEAAVNDRNNIRLSFSHRYTDNKKLRFEIVELKRQLRKQTAWFDVIKNLAKVKDVPNQSVAENKNSRDRDILSEFVLLPADREDDVLLHLTCGDMEPVPRATDLLRVYFVARSHMEKHHKEENNA